MMGFLLTIVKAAEFSRSSILIKVDSTYVVNLFINGSGEIPWQVHNRWFLVFKIARALRVVVSHNFKDSNSIADKLALELLDMRNNIGGASCLWTLFSLLTEIIWILFTKL